MRWRGKLLVCAVAASGCAAPRHLHEQAGTRQWAELCHRLRSPATSSPSVSPRPRVATAGEVAQLHRIARRSMSSIVQVRTVVARRAFDESDIPDAHGISSMSGGTGVLIGADGIILTSAHVVRNASAMTVAFPDGSDRPVRKVAIDDRHDIAVVQVGGVRSVTPLSPGTEVPIRGTPVVAVASPLQRESSPFRTGVITNSRATLQDELDPTGGCCYGELIESTAQMESGFSGGPLLDGEGRFVGINVAVAGPVGTDRYRGYAIPFDSRIRRVIERLTAIVTTDANDDGVLSEIRFPN